MTRRCCHVIFHIISVHPFLRDRKSPNNIRGIHCPLSPVRTYKNFAGKNVHGELCFRIAFYNKDSGSYRVSRNAHRCREHFRALLKVWT